MKRPVIEAINRIINPFDGIEKQLSEVQRLLIDRRIQGPKRMSALVTGDNDNQEVPELPCPVCIEAASEIIEGKGLVPEHALQRYTFAQLLAHLESNKHNQKEFIEVALRASIFLYREAFEHAHEKIEKMQ